MVELNALCVGYDITTCKSAVSCRMYNSSKMPRTFGRSARTPRPPRTAPAGKHRRPHTARGPTISAKGLTMKIIMMKSKKKFVALDAKMEEISRRFGNVIFLSSFGPALYTTSRSSWRIEFIRSAMYTQTNASLVYFKCTHSNSFYSSCLYILSFSHLHHGSDE